MTSLLYFIALLDYIVFTEILFVYHRILHMLQTITLNDYLFRSNFIINYRPECLRETDTEAVTANNDDSGIPNEDLTNLSISGVSGDSPTIERRFGCKILSVIICCNMAHLV